MTTALVILGALFILIYGGLAVVAMRRPLLARLAAREALRRPTQSVLLVIGLMIAGASILAALVIADSTEDSLTKSIWQEWGRVDLLITANGQDFSRDVARRLAADPAIRAGADGVQPGLELPIAVADLDRNLTQSTVRLIGFDPTTQKAFGPFILVDGRHADGMDLPTGSVLISRNLADALDARVGDRLQLTLTDRPIRTLTVAGIASSSGPGGYGLVPSVFTSLATTADLTGSDHINVVRIAAKGNGRAELDAARALLPSVRAVLRNDRGSSNLTVRETKTTELDSLVRPGASRGVYLSFSFLVVIAAAIVAINLVLAVATERRPRLAILRALGLTRRGMILTSVLEGALYSLAAAALSVVPGIVLPALVVQQFGNGLHVSDLLGATFPVALYLKPATIMVGVAAAALITLLTLAVASWRTSRMTIAVAIRNLPEPLPIRRARLLGQIFAVALTVAAVPAVVAGNFELRLLGGVVLIGAVLTVARRFLPNRARGSLFGGALSIWALVDWPFVSNAAELSLPILVLVVGLCVLVVANLPLLENAVTLVGRNSGKPAAVLRPPLAYLCRRPLRTGLATAGFGIVLTLIVMFGVALASQEAFLRHALSYDLRVSAAGPQPVVLPAPVDALISQRVAIRTQIYSGPFTTQGTATQNSLFKVYSFSDDQLGAPPIPLLQRDPRFENDAGVWRALRADPRLVLSTIGGGSGVITLAGDHGPVGFQVIGQQVPGTLDGIIGSQAALADFQSRPVESTLLAKLRPGADPTNVARLIQRSAFPRPIGVSAASEGVEPWLRGTRAWVGSIVLLIGLGLVSGVLTIGILALRAVIERRHAMGVLRALGYRRHHMVAGLIAESGLTTSIGVVVGLVAGTILGIIFEREIGSQGGPVAIDWGLVGPTLLLIYATLSAVTIAPALQTSRLAPAQALRLLE